MKLTPRQIATANLLATGKSGREACERVGIDQTTLVRWKRQREFVDYLSQLMCEVEKESLHTLHSLRCRAAERLGELLESNAPGIALKAAEAILARTNQPYSSFGTLDNGNKLLIEVLNDLESIDQ